MKRCLYIAEHTPFDVPSGTSFCFYYIVFCRNNVTTCPFNHASRDVVRLIEFEIYPVISNQLSLFDDFSF